MLISHNDTDSKLLTSSSRIEEFEWGRMEWLADHGSHPGLDASLAKMVLRGERASPCHRHDTCAEIVHIISGAVTLNIDGHDPRHMNAGTTAVVPMNVAHWFVNASQNEVELMITYTSGERDYVEVDRR